MNFPDFSENALIEQPAIGLFRELGWETVNCFHEFDPAMAPSPQSSPSGRGSFLGWESPAEVVLLSRLQPARETLNPDLPEKAILLAIEELTRDRSAMSVVQANREVYRMIREGVKGKCAERAKGSDEETRVVKAIDWDNPGNNDFLLCSQF